MDSNYNCFTITCLQLFVLITHKKFGITWISSESDFKSLEPLEHEVNQVKKYEITLKCYETDLKSLKLLEKVETWCFHPSWIFA